MKTNTHNFLSDLQELLEKYKAEIIADDHYEGYPESGRDIRMTVEFDNAPEIDLGEWINEYAADGLSQIEYPVDGKGEVQ